MRNVRLGTLLMSIDIRKLLDYVFVSSPFDLVAPGSYVSVARDTRIILANKSTGVNHKLCSKI